MARVIKNVAIAGATGTLGSHILRALVDTRAFNITVLTRGSNKPLPTGVTSKEVDYTSLPSLLDAVRGQDAVIDSTYSQDAEGPCLLIDACIAAHVYRYIPPEFGSDPLNEAVQKLPFFRRKVTTTKYLFDKVNVEDGLDLTWTAIACGPFLEPPLEDGSLGIDLKRKEVTLFGDGTTVSPWSTLDAVGKATAQVLLKPEETKNRVLYISSVNLSQSRLGGLAEEALGGEWRADTLDVQKLHDDAQARMQKGEMDMEVIFAFLKYSMSSETYTYPWTKDDNDLLNVERLTEEQVKSIILEKARQEVN
ncbi:related to isoflavone reductase family protein CipA [Cephalotrichum gorgonifer]|uniref:Related to isoflavone reductase family protein CipA n=1 Tax=Cephalotrichum gorgonifer TaxID=2041049 RepID=A0AAE8MWJ8_9PEZI|nr:related to isoflavone reductase family protein CipA [Cephalotrichum gorgonifer]